MKKKRYWGIGGPKKPEEDEEKLFETIGKAADKIGETQVGKKIGTIITVVMLAILSGGANMSIIHEFFEWRRGYWPNWWLFRRKCH